MRYAGTIRWNGNIVFHGACSATIAHTLLQHMRENFAGTSFNHLATVLPTLAMLHTATPGATFENVFADETGGFSYRFDCIAPRV